MKTKVFISYAKEDVGFAKRLHADVCSAGVEPWLDRYELTPGQDWDLRIREAIGQCDYFLAVLSNCSVTKSGYVQKEIRNALEIAEQKPEGSIFIVPVRIDDCEPSFESLRRLHRADLFPDYDQGLKELLRAFNYASEEKPELIILDEIKRKGKIKKVLNGFGFISCFVEKDIFFHASELDGVDFESLRERDIVLFYVGKGPQGPAAVEIELA